MQIYVHSGSESDSQDIIPRNPKFAGRMMSRNGFYILLDKLIIKRKWVDFREIFLFCDVDTGGYAFKMA